MANKITQLVNKDGDNLYPLSGGLLSDSVTTDMLQDESVTSDKVDWTTIKYSTSEEQPIGVWIDGKTIYRKVVNFGTLPDTTSKWVNPNISNLGTIVHLEAIADNGSGTYLVIPYTHDSSMGLQMSLAFTNNTIQITTGTNRSNYSAVCIIEYTKSS